MSLATLRSRLISQARSRYSRIGGLERTFSSSPPGSNAAQPQQDNPPGRPHEVLLTVQTHTGIGNMAHALHILRAIEKEYGPISSYLFPRTKEAGSGDYLPSFFFKFRHTQSLYKLSKPYTHLDIPAFLPQSEPNHTIGLQQIHGLIAPIAHSSPSGERSQDPVKTRFALRIEVSEKEDYPQPRLSPLANAVQKKEYVQRAIATWEPAARLFRTRKSRSEPLNIPKTSTAAYADNASPDVLVEDGGRGQDPSLLTSHPRVELPESPPLRMRPRSNNYPTQTSSSPTTHDPADTKATVAASSLDTEPTTPPGDDLPARSVQHSNTKRERILEQTRRAAATEAKLLADRKAAAEAAAAAAQRASETEAQARQNTPLSIWSRFMGR